MPVSTHHPVAGKVVGGILFVSVQMEGHEKVNSMKRLISALTAAMAVVSVSHADKISDPFGLRTESIGSRATYFIFNDQDSSVFTPASSSWESSGSMVGAGNHATVDVTNQGADMGFGADQISFEWSNLNLYSAFGFTATGSATTTFSLGQNASLSMMEMQNIGSLSSQATWSIQLFNESDQFLGSLNQLGDTYELEAERTYQLSFQIGGNDTRSASGSVVSWGMNLDYIQPPPAVVPGFGGLALFASCGMRRRRRRK